MKGYCHNQCIIVAYRSVIYGESVKVEEIEIQTSKPLWQLSKKIRLISRIETTNTEHHAPDDKLPLIEPSMDWY